MRRIEDLRIREIKLTGNEAGDSDPAVAETNGSGARSPKEQRQCGEFRAWI